MFVAIALGVKLTTTGPVFFRQTRTGIGGSPFDMLKFRTMVVDAEDRLGALMDLNEGSGPLFKLRDDPV